MKKYIIWIVFGLIITIAIVLRFYRLESFAPAISWDEAAVGYNAYTIAHWGRDEWGNILPLAFKSFGDYKNPVHIYLTVPFVAIFGLSAFSVRFSPALFGVFNVIVIFFLGTRLFKNKWAGILASLFLALSAYNIQFSRFNHELNFALFFFMLAYLLFLKGLEKPKYLIYAFLCFGVDLLTYPSAKIVTPLIVATLVFIYIKDLWKFKKYLLFAVLTFFSFIVLFFANPDLFGIARLKQNQIEPKEIQATTMYQKYNNNLLGTLEVVALRYTLYFKQGFLFETGDPIPRHSAQIVGTFYKIDMFLLPVGLVGILYCIFWKKKKEYIPLLVWAFIAPIPGAASSSFAHAARGMFMTGSWHLISVFGALTIVNLVKNNYLKICISIFGLIIILIPLFKYLNYYYGEFSRRYAIEWQYGMKNIAEFIKDNKWVTKVYMTDAFSQPYIFLLFYLKTPLPEFLSTVEYNNTQSRPSNLVKSFGNRSKYNFIWDQIHSEPYPGVLYILNPSKYDGLYNRATFNVDELVKYPNDTDAFFIVSAMNQ